MKAIPAIYHHGAFHPLAPIELPEKTNVEVLLPNDSGEAADFDALRRTAGVWANLPGIDDAMEAVEESRREATFRNASLTDDAT